VNDATRRSNDGAAIDQLSPELALVDADLARIARSQMPDHPMRFAAVPESASVAEPPARADPPNGTEPSPQPTPLPQTLRAAIASRRIDPATATEVSRDERFPSATEPARTHFVVGAGAARARRSDVETVVEPSASVDGRPSRTRPRRLRWLLLVVGLLLLGVAALVAAFAWLAGDHGERGAGAPVAVSGASQSEAPKPRTTTVRRTARSSSPQPRARRAARAAPRGQSSAPAARTSSPAQVFVWLPVQGARRYKVQFFRSGKKVFEATTSKARLTLPRRWTFGGRRFELTPGSYRWLVRPGFGPRSSIRYGKAVVASSWTVQR
jgi:hypothetical protein